MFNVSITLLDDSARCAVVRKLRGPAQPPLLFGAVTTHRSGKDGSATGGVVDWGWDRRVVAVGLKAFPKNSQSTFLTCVPSIPAVPEPKRRWDSDRQPP